MSDPLLSLLAASIAFVGSHFALSHPLRAPLVSALGENGFRILYSLVALATIAWMAFAFRAAPTADLPGSGEVGWIIATIITLPALALLLGSFRGNPALPAPGAAQLAAREPAGIFRVTRHPMMWAFALWAISHIVLWWSVRTLIVAGAILLLALVGAHLQDRKKETLMGAAWAGWEAKTSYWPRWGALLKLNPLLWLGALAAWWIITWSHIHAAGVPAGIWRWLG